MKVFSSILTLILLSASIALGAADPFAGKWAMNLQKSKYAKGMLPKQMTIDMETVGNGVRYHSESTAPGGKVSVSNYTADYNGPQVIVMGAAGMLAPVSLKRIDANTVEAAYMKALAVVATSKRVVSKDGRTMTITTTSKDAAGTSITNIGVYDRVDTVTATAK